MLIAIFLVSFLSSCTSIPLRSIYKLMRLDVLELEPDQVRVATMTTSDFEVTKLYLRLIESGDEGVKNHMLPLKIDSTPAYAAELDRDLKGGHRLYVLFLIPGGS